MIEIESTAKLLQRVIRCAPSVIPTPNPNPTPAPTPPVIYPDILPVTEPIPMIVPTVRPTMTPAQVHRVTQKSSGGRISHPENHSFRGLFFLAWNLGNMTRDWGTTVQQQYPNWLSNNTLIISTIRSLPNEKLW